jgi:hypothetical protein
MHSEGGVADESVAQLAPEGFIEPVDFELNTTCPERHGLVDPSNGAKS